ncbi:MFS transporter [Shinella zoogloeoides]|uniref:MFS transporter n=1 Tax=Shinella zoogloeoides TaxID=352475 RepID=UPI00299D8EE6|nr:MFS transporter [Shinella zoogloeoides]WPE23569.1 Inner membrane protein YbjJ [Shinella zoogloeoides]
MIAAHQRPYLAFFLLAIATGAFMARIPDLQTRLAVNKAELGMTLIGLAIGSLISLSASAPIIARLGSKRTFSIAIPAIGLLLALTPVLPGAGAVFGCLFLTGLFTGTLELALNIEIGRIEAQKGVSIMNRSHGFWSVGFFVTAVTASFIRQAEIPMTTHMIVMATIVVLLSLVVVKGMENATIPKVVEEQKAPLIAFPTLSLMPLCIIGISACLVEGAGLDWSAIYMRDVFKSEPFIGGSGLTLFAFFMALARVTIDPVVDRFGARVVAQTLLTVAAIGLAIVWLSPHEYAALAGFAMMGGGCSAVYPMALSAAAQRTDRASAVNVAAVGQMAFVVFFLAPPLLGFVAEAWGMRMLYAICLPLILVAIFASGALNVRRAAKPAISAVSHETAL